MANHLVWHVELGMLDLSRPALGRPELHGLQEILLQDHRSPLSARGLQCGGICRDLGYVEWMHIYRRGNGTLVAAHQRTEGEKRHESHESDEHKAYKERTVRTADAAGFPAEAEVRTADGKVIHDVLIHGIQPTAIEIQRSRKSATHIRTREKAAIDRGVLSAWHTDRRDMFDRNEVPWTRTDANLPPQLIIGSPHLQIRGGFRHLEMERCDERAARPCPTKGTGRCGKRHPKSSPTQILYDDFVRGVPAGDIVQIAVKERRQTFRFWTTLEESERYEDSLGQSARVQPQALRQRSRTNAGGRATCAGRAHASQAGPVFDASGEPIPPCRFCGEPASLLGPEGEPEHWTCRRRQEAAA